MKSCELLTEVSINFTSEEVRSESAERAASNRSIKKFPLISLQKKLEGGMLCQRLMERFLIVFH